MTLTAGWVLTSHADGPQRSQRMLPSFQNQCHQVPMPSLRLARRELFRNGYVLLVVLRGGAWPARHCRLPERLDGPQQFDTAGRGTGFREAALCARHAAPQPTPWYHRPWHATCHSTRYRRDSSTPTGRERPVTNRRPPWGRGWRLAAARQPEQDETKKPDASARHSPTVAISTVTWDEAIRTAGGRELRPVARSRSTPERAQPGTVDGQKGGSRWGGAYGSVAVPLNVRPQHAMGPAGRSLTSG